jgi:hypothetical protein
MAKGIQGDQGREGQGSGEAGEEFDQVLAELYAYCLREQVPISAVRAAIGSLVHTRRAD